MVDDLHHVRYCAYRGAHVSRVHLQVSVCLYFFECGAPRQGGGIEEWKLVQINATMEMNNLFQWIQFIQIVRKNSFATTPQIPWWKTEQKGLQQFIYHIVVTVHEVSWQLVGSRDGLCCRGSRLGLSQLSEHLLAGPSKLSPHHTGTRPTCKFRVTEKEDLFLFSFCLFVDPCFGVPQTCLQNLSNG